MGLTATKALRLEDAKLDKLFEEKQQLWRSLAQETIDYVRKMLAESKEPVRPDDLITPLVQALEASPVLRKELATKKLPQKYWNQWFAELIVDRLWGELDKGEAN